MSIGPKEAALRAQREGRFGRSLVRQIDDSAKTAKATLRKLLPNVTKSPLPKPPKSATIASTKNKGGRPRKENALTPADKQRAYRERKAKEAAIKGAMRKA